MMPGFDNIEIESPVRAEWFGMWPGTVVDVNDPDKRGKIRVRVPQIYGATTESEFIPDNMLPWARPSFSAHDLSVPDVGDGVWVSFWDGHSWKPRWHGQFLGADDAPEEFTSSYTPGPKTRIIRTTTGHIIEMRWVDGEEKIRIVTAGGSELNMKDAAAEGGPLIEAFTVGGYKMSLDENQQSIKLETPAQNIEIDEAGGEIKMTATTKVTVTSPAVDVLGTGQVTYKGTPCLLGPDAPARDKLMKEAFIAFFNTHVHAGIGSPPAVGATPGLHSTVNVQGN